MQSAEDLFKELVQVKTLPLGRQLLALPPLPAVAPTVVAVVVAAAVVVVAAICVPK